jgi:uncharacterized protein (DUF2384 family)
MPRATKKPHPKGDPDDRKSTLDLIAEVIPDSEQWLDTPHPLLGTKSPRELIGCPEEAVLRNLVLGLKDGIFS